jgi:hypothetical protein
MTRDDIIQLALEHFGAVLKPSDLEVKLAALAVAAEREACAKVAGPHLNGEIAAAIRARGE